MTSLSKMPSFNIQTYIAATLRSLDPMASVPAGGSCSWPLTWAAVREGVTDEATFLVANTKGAAVQKEGLLTLADIEHTEALCVGEDTWWLRLALMRRHEGR